MAPLDIPIMMMSDEIPMIVPNDDAPK